MPWNWISHLSRTLRRKANIDTARQFHPDHFYFQETPLAASCRAKHQAGGPVAGGMADRAAAAVRPRAEVPPQEPRRPALVLRVSGRQSRNSQSAHRVHIRGAEPGDNLLLVRRFRHQLARHLQARRVHPRPAAERSAAPQGALAGRLPAALQRSAAPLRRPARGPLPPRQRLPRRAGAPRRRVLRRRWRAAARGLRTLRAVPRRAPADRTTNSAAATTCWHSSPSSATPRRAGRRGPGVPARHPQPRPSRICSRCRSTTIRRKARCSPPGRPLPDRRRDGPGQDDPGHRRRRDHGPAARRRARAHRLPDVAQAPVGARDRALHRPARRRSSAAAAAARRRRCRRRPFFKIINYDTVHRDLDLIAGWSPDLVILDEAQRIKNWKTRAARSVKQIAVALRHRADRHAAREPARGTRLHRPVRRPLPPRADVPPAARPPGARRASARSSATATSTALGAHARADPVPPAEETRCSTSCRSGIDKNCLRADDRRSRCEHHEENQEIVARIVQKWRRYELPVRSRSATADDRPAEDAHVLRQHLPARSRDRPRRQGRRADHAAAAKCSNGRTPRSSSSASGCACTSCSVRDARDGTAGTTSSSTAACPGRKRKDLVDRFRDDRDCRLFLSTDAGGVGLNLQHASVVVEPRSALEPGRAGAAHRPGPPARARRSPVQVVNFVAQGTIEEGMLVGADVQEVAVRRRPRRRREGSLPRRQPADEVHGNGRDGDGEHSQSTAGGRRRFRP